MYFPGMKISLIVEILGNYQTKVQSVIFLDELYRHNTHSPNWWSLDCAVNKFFSKELHKSKKVATEKDKKR